MCIEIIFKNKQQIAKINKDKELIIFDLNNEDLYLEIAKYLNINRLTILKEYYKRVNKYKLLKLLKEIFIPKTFKSKLKSEIIY